MSYGELTQQALPGFEQLALQNIGEEESNLPETLANLKVSKEYFSNGTFGMSSYTASAITLDEFTTFSQNHLNNARAALDALAEYHPNLLRDTFAGNLQTDINFLYLKDDLRCSIESLKHAFKIFEFCDCNLDRAFNFIDFYIDKIDAFDLEQKNASLAKLAADAAEWEREASASEA